MLKLDHTQGHAKHNSIQDQHGSLSERTTSEFNLWICDLEGHIHVVKRSIRNRTVIAVMLCFVPTMMKNDPRPPVDMSSGPLTLFTTIHSLDPPQQTKSTSRSGCQEFHQHQLPSTMFWKRFGRHGRISDEDRRARVSLYNRDCHRWVFSPPAVPLMLRLCSCGGKERSKQT
jgi:hypothetical protein